MSSLVLMAKPTNENKLTARTAPDVVDGVKMAVLEMARRKLKYRGRTIGIEGLVGAVMLEFLDRPRDEQEALLRASIPRLEAMFSAGDPVPEVGKMRGAKASPKPRAKETG